MQTKLIRQFMTSYAPPPEGTTQELTFDVALIRALLVAKLHEEAEEVARAGTREELAFELADLYEVWHSLCMLHKFSLNEIIDRAHYKADQRGPLLSSDMPGKTRALLHRTPTL